MIYRREKRNIGHKNHDGKVSSVFSSILAHSTKKMIKAWLEFYELVSDMCCLSMSLYYSSRLLGNIANNFALPFRTIDDKSNSITCVSIIRLIRRPTLSTNEYSSLHIESLVAFRIDKFSFFLKYIPFAIFTCFKFNSLSILFKNLFSGKYFGHICVLLLDTCKRTKYTKNHAAWPIMTL